MTHRLPLHHRTRAPLRLPNLRPLLWLLLILGGTHGALCYADANQALAKRVLDPSVYQTELPAAELEAKDPSRRSRALPPSLDPPSILSTLAYYLLWALAVIATILLAAWALNAFKSRTKPLVSLEAAPGPATRERAVTRPLEEAQALAQEGRYREAIHSLLLRTLEELHQRLAAPLAPSLTSREILDELSLSTEARVALTDMVSAVEVTHFGHHQPRRAEYERCLVSFRRFAEAFLKGGEIARSHKPYPTKSKK